MDRLFVRLFELRIGDFLSMLEYTDEIIGITALIMSFLSCIISSDGQSKESFLRLLKYCVVACCVLVGLTLWIGEKWSVVPDLYGLTYNDAVNELHDNDLLCIVLLSSSDDIRTGQDLRVVWQSSVKNSVSRKGDSIFIILDNNFGYEYNPISKPIGFIDGRDWEWIKQNNAVSIRLPVPYENMKGSTTTAIAFDVYADCLASTLEAIAMDYIDSNPIVIPIGSKSLNDYVFVGKICAYNNNDYRIKAVNTTLANGTIFLPIVMNDDYYGFHFSFYDEDGNHYDHSIPIKFLSEESWKNYVTED